MAAEPNTPVAAPDAAIVRVVDNIKKSDSDSWNYRGLELSNEMLVVLISHPKIDKAAAALDVSIGSLADPRDVPGIAHFLEHMLFMGSAKVSSPPSRSPTGHTRSANFSSIRARTSTRS